jgi:hypothetical protein
MLTKVSVRPGCDIRLFELKATKLPYGGIPSIGTHDRCSGVTGDRFAANIDAMPLLIVKAFASECNSRMRN